MNQVITVGTWAGFGQGLGQGGAEGFGGRGA
jgi:hypothetical protein